MILEPFDMRKEYRRCTILGLGLSADIAVSFLVYMGLLRVTRSLGIAPVIGSSLDRWLSVAVQYGIAFPFCAWVMCHVPADPMERRDLTWDELVQYALMIAFLLMAGMLIGNRINQMLSGLLGHTPVDPLADLMSPELLLYSVVTSCILAPLSEEFLLRRILLDRLNRLGDRTCILVSGLAFALMHGNFYQFFYALLAGMLLAYIYLRTGKLRYTVGLHMMVNTLFGVLPAAMDLLGDGLAASVLIGALNWMDMAAAAAGLILFIRHRRDFHVLKGWLNVGTGGILAVVLLNPGSLLFVFGCLVQFVLFLR